MAENTKGWPKAKNIVCLWYDKDAEEAARFYAESFPDGFVGAVHPTILRAGRAMCWWSSSMSPESPASA